MPGIRGLGHPSTRTLSLIHRKIFIKGNQFQFETADKLIFILIVSPEIA
jgi:hypothetical protein